MKQNTLIIPSSPIPIKRIVRDSSFFFPLLFFEIDLGISDALCHSLVAEVSVRHECETRPSLMIDGLLSRVRSKDSLLLLLYHVRTQLYTL